MKNILKPTLKYSILLSLLFTVLSFDYVQAGKRKRTANDTRKTKKTLPTESEISLERIKDLKILLHKIKEFVAVFCPICLSGPKDDAQKKVYWVKCPKCGIIYHHECLLKWLNARNRNCPSCRGDLTKDIFDKLHKVKSEVLYESSQAVDEMIKFLEELKPLQEGQQIYFNFLIKEVENLKKLLDDSVKSLKEACIRLDHIDKEIAEKQCKFEKEQQLKINNITNDFKFKEQELLRNVDEQKKEIQELNEDQKEVVRKLNVFNKLCCEIALYLMDKKKSIKTVVFENKIKELVVFIEDNQFYPGLDLDFGRQILQAYEERLKIESAGFLSRFGL